jgi:hypothetical protein
MFHIVSRLLYRLVVSSTGIFSYTSTWVLGIKSPSSPVYVGGSGTNDFVLTFSKEYALVVIKTYSCTKTTEPLNLGIVRKKSSHKIGQG